MVVIAHNFEGQECKQVGNYTPHAIHWGSLSGIQLTSGYSEGSKQASVTCRVPWWGQLEAGLSGTLFPLCVISGPPHMSLQQGHWTSSTVAQGFKTRVPRS